MEYFESVALENSHLKPKSWFRYVDDTFNICPHGYFSQHPDIKFTMEVEKDDLIPFLDILVTRKASSRLDQSVYRKPMHTLRQLHGGHSSIVSWPMAPVIRCKS
ncbi:hypothetical protein Trydic_g7475 [Trypoxylus dichotomus]